LISLLNEIVPQYEKTTSGNSLPLIASSHLHIAEDLYHQPVYQAQQNALIDYLSTFH
jgi:hypothetical protein